MLLLVVVGGKVKDKKENPSDILSAYIQTKDLLSMELSEKPAYMVFISEDCPPDCPVDSPALGPVSVDVSGRTKLYKSIIDIDKYRLNTKTACHAMVLESYV